MTSSTKATSAGSTSGQGSRLGSIRRGTLATRASSPSADGSGAPSRRGARFLVALTLATAFLLALAAAPALALNTHILSNTFGASGSGDGQLALVAFDQNTGTAGSELAVNQSTHDVYVADTANHRIDQFDSSGTFIRAFGADVGGSGVNVCTTGCAAGTPGSAPGAFTTPAFISVDNSGGASQGDVYVGDTTDSIVTKFDASGNLIAAWGSGGQLDGSTATAPIAGPFGPLAGIAVDTSGHLWVYDTNGDMFSFAQDASFTTDWNSGRGVAPAGIAVDSATDLYVVTGLESVTKFTSSGTQIGDLQSDFDGTTGLAIDPANDNLYVDAGGVIHLYLAGCDASVGCTASDSFGSSDLSAAAGLAVDGAGHHVFAADTGHSRIADFAPGILPDLTTLAATAVGPTTTTLNGHVDPAGGPDTTDCHFDWGADTSYGHTAPCSEGNSFSTPVDVHADLAGLTSGATYHYRLVVTNPDGQVTGQDASFSTLPPPSIDAAAAQNLTPTDADLTALINPNGIDTTYHFDWGADSTYGTTVPIPDGDVGAGTTDVDVSTHLTGLTQNTTYHWRIVATNAAGTVGASVDHTFLYATTGQGLPDNRAYEQVTPVHKNGAAIGIQFLGLEPDVSDAGQRMTATATQCFADAASCPAARGQIGTPYAFDRTASGWQPTALAPPATQFDSNTVWGTSATAGTAIFSAPSPPGGQDDFYARQPGGAFTHIGPLSDPADGSTADGTAVLQGRVFATPDFSHLAWQFQNRWPFDATAGINAAYQYGGAANSQPLLVGVSGGPGSTDLISTCGTSLPLHPDVLSADGRTLFFTAVQCSSGSGANAGVPVPADTLYARLDGDLPTAHTVPISERSALDCATPACTTSTPSLAHYEGASADGSRVLFTSTEQLTDAATQDPRPQDSAVQCTINTGPNGCNLYLYDFSKASGHQLTAVSAGDTSGHGPGVQGLMGVSPDGSRVYYLANGVLAPGANPGDCLRNNFGSFGHCSLYVYDADTGANTFIATLPTLRDSANWAQSDVHVANVTPDGRFLVFQSHAQLTPDDTSSPTAGQLFRYDAQTGDLARISIGEHGLNDNGNTPGAVACAPSLDVCPLDASIVMGSQLERVGPLRTDPTMSHDGSRVFFTSPLALTPHALDRVSTGTNSLGDPVYARNVYQWQEAGTGDCPASRPEGCVSLISDGRDTTASNPPSCSFANVVGSSVCLIGADATGDNVFFTTTDRLVPQDTDTQLDFYDARVGGGIPYTPPPPSCQGDACRGAGTNAPPATGAGSGVFNGPGNPPVKRKPHKKHHHKKRHHKRSHKRANSNRGGQK